MPGRKGRRECPEGVKDGVLDLAARKDRFSINKRNDVKLLVSLRGKYDVQVCVFFRWRPCSQQNMDSSIRACRHHSHTLSPQSK